MIEKIKRWFPFISLVGIAVFFFIYLLLPNQQAMYVPHTSDPDRIYRDACSYCHGLGGEGEGLLYPALGEENLERSEIAKIIREGALFMPAFNHIKNDTLAGLVEYIYNREFLKRQNLK